MPDRDLDGVWNEAYGPTREGHQAVNPRSNPLTPGNDPLNKIHMPVNNLGSDFYELELTPEQTELLEPVIRKQASNHRGLLFVSLAPVRLPARKDVPARCVLQLQGKWLAWDKAQKVLKLLQPDSKP
jgi:hypothetical protein